MMTVHPRLVLLLSILAPGAGHLALGRTGRAFGLAFFTLFFAALTWKICPADRSWIGRTAAGLFVWALSIPDAYQSAVRRRLANGRSRVPV